MYVCEKLCLSNGSELANFLSKKKIMQPHLFYIVSEILHIINQHSFIDSWIINKCILYFVIIV